MKKIEMKGSKPSKMGLHHTVRYVVKPSGATRQEQEESIVFLTMDLHEAIHRVLFPDETPGMFTWKFARFISKSFLFEGFADDEIYNILGKAVDRNRKKQVL